MDPPCPYDVNNGMHDEKTCTLSVHSEADADWHECSVDLPDPNECP